MKKVNGSYTGDI